MLFDHSANLPFQLLGWVIVFVGLIVLNEFGEAFLPTARQLISGLEEGLVKVRDLKRSEDSRVVMCTRSFAYHPTLEREIYSRYPSVSLANSDCDFDDAFDSRIKIGTIHTFQGSECDVIIFDMVDCFVLENGNNNKIGRLYKGDSGERLLNVAISRARHKLIVVCDPEYIKNIPGNRISQNSRSLFNKLSKY